MCRKEAGSNDMQDCVHNIGKSQEKTKNEVILKLFL